MPERRKGRATKKAKRKELPEPEAKIRAANVSVASNTFLFCIKMVAGLLMGSVSVLAEGIHSGMDLLAAIIACLAVRTSGQPADDKHAYGHWKFESISGVVEAALIFIAAIIIIYQAAQKLLGHGEVEGLGWGVVVMGVSAVLNFFVSRYLMAVARRSDSVALEADSLHLSTDVLTSVGVMVGLALIALTDQHWIDPAAALIVAALIMKAAYDLTRKAAGELIDVALSNEELGTIRSVVIEHTGMFVNIHKIRTRKAGGFRFIDLHVVVHKDMHVHDAHGIAHHIGDDLQVKLGAKTNTLVHIEPCEARCSDCPAECNHTADTDVQ